MNRSFDHIIRKHTHIYILYIYIIPNQFRLGIRRFRLGGSSRIAGPPRSDWWAARSNGRRTWPAWADRRWDASLGPWRLGGFIHQNSKEKARYPRWILSLIVSHFLWISSVSSSNPKDTININTYFQHLSAEGCAGNGEKTPLGSPHGDPSPPMGSAQWQVIVHDGVNALPPQGDHQRKPRGRQLATNAPL